MAEPIQAADLAIYCVNWAFRIPTRGMNAPERPEIADRYGAWLSALQFRGQGSRDGAAFDTYGVVFVPDPYTPRERAKRKEATPSKPPESGL